MARGKYEETYYYKVVSNRADSEDAVECLVFPSTPIITFTHNRHLHWQVTDGILGTYRYEGIAGESIATDSIARYLSEITNEEYEEAARRHLERVLNADWRDVVDSCAIERNMREAMLKIREDLHEAEEDRARDFEGYSIEEIADKMDSAIEGME